MQNWVELPEKDCKLLHSVTQRVLQVNYIEKNPALVYDDGNNQASVSYPQLTELIKESSTELLKYFNSNEYIGIDANGNLEIVIALLALLNCKAVVCPLDLCGDFEQSIKLCKTLNIKFIIIDNVNLRSYTRIQKWISTDGLPINILSSLKGRLSIIQLNLPHTSFQGRNDIIEYVVQSSGSTGPSKIIQVPGQCIYPNILDLCSKFNITPRDTIFLSSPLTFDASIVQIFISLLGGATLLIVPSVIKKQPSKLCSVLFERNKTTLLQATPSLVHQLGQQLLNSDKRFCDTSVRVVCLGAEPFPAKSSIKALIGDASTIEVYNIYGISEVSSWASLQRVDSAFFEETKTDVAPIMLDANEEVIQQFCLHSVPIGEPLSGTVIEVQSEDGRKVGNGFGRICIGGEKRVCLVADETSLTPNMMRFSGDIGLIRNGKIYYIERSDNRVKIFGKFVDLEFVEAIAQEFSAVDSAVCVVTKAKNVSNLQSYLTLFVSFTGTIQAQEEIERKILTRLQSRLPSQSIPSRIEFISSIPVTSHGKMDRSALQRIADSISNEPLFHSDLLEEQLLKLFENCLQNGSYASVDCVNDKSFIENGGNSVMAVFVETETRKLVESISSDKTRMPMLYDFILSKDFKTLVDYLKYENDKNISTLCLSSPNRNTSLKRGLENSDESSWPSLPNRKHENVEEDTDSEDCITSSKKQNIEKLCCKTSACYCSISRGNKWSLCKPCASHDRSSTNQNKISEISLQIFKFNIRWKKDTLKCVDASPLVVFQGDHYSSIVYIGSHSHYFMAIEVETGGVVWRTELGDRIESSAALSKDGEKLIVGCYDHSVYILKRSNGNILWKFETGDCVKSSPITHPETGVVYVGSHDQFIYALDVDNYEELWRRHCGGGSCFSSPALATDKNEKSKVFIGTLAGNLVAIESCKGGLLWMFSTKKPIFSSPITFNQMVCVGCVGGLLYTVKMEDGQLLWKMQTEGPIFSSPTFINSMSMNLENLIVIGSHDCRLYCVNANGGLIWKFKASSPIYSTSTFVACEKDHNSAENSLLSSRQFVVACSTEGKMFLIDIKTGSLMANWDFPKEVFSSPVTHGNKIVVGCRDNYVYCLEIS